MILYKTVILHTVPQVNQSDDGSYRMLPDPMIRQLPIGFLGMDLLASLVKVLRVLRVLRIVAMSLNGLPYIPVTAAGTGSVGSGSTQFAYPSGIFFDVNFTLYVADWGNS